MRRRFLGSASARNMLRRTSAARRNEYLYLQLSEKLIESLRKSRVKTFFPAALTARPCWIRTTGRLRPTQSWASE